ncbi:MAG: DUF1343 domain-containing protein, partial [Verrucomicrobia bacterium]|nr:DUF1343 domain-containing protein [Verrucomicrobiota bacterium]
MRESNAFQPGLETLLSSKAGWLRGRRVALLSHAAAVDRQGCNSATRLAAAANLVALFSPEHGYNSDAPAGAPVANRRHPDLGITIRSLYGEQHKPTPAMLRDIDLIVVDLQDLGVRCYTYVSTLRHLLHAAASAGKSVIIADRPIPLPHVVDGPPRDEAFDSFVAAVSCPLVYGMTPGETAQWICAQDQLEINCRVAPMRNYHRDSMRGSGWPPWLPPSPGIATWESAWCYPATVFTEAMPSVSCGRTGRLPFQVLGAPWL